MSKKLLVVVTGIEKYPTLERPTGIWLGEAVHFVAKVEAAGFAVDYVSPLGGYTPIDPHSLALAEAIDWEWYHNKVFLNRLGTTLKPSDVNPVDYAGIYFVGGHGVMWDFPDDAGLQALSRAIYEQGGVVAAVCHGVVALLNVTLSDGSALIAGKKVTGFSSEEERQVQLDHAIPFMTEEALVQRGGQYSKADQPWAAYAIADQRVITGQNPASGGAVADLVIAALRD